MSGVYGTRRQRMLARIEKNLEESGALEGIRREGVRA